MSQPPKLFIARRVDTDCLQIEARENMIFYKS